VEPGGRERADDPLAVLALNRLRGELVAHDAVIGRRATSPNALPPAV
jgi:hypothetical protein